MMFEQIKGRSLDSADFTFSNIYIINDVSDKAAALVHFYWEIINLKFGQNKRLEH